MHKHSLTILILTFALLLSACRNDDSAENTSDESKLIADSSTAASAETGSLVEETEVSSELMGQLVENVKSMQSVMKWFVYGLDVIEVDQDVTYFLDDGTYYYKISDPVFSENGINSINSMKEYLGAYFTAEYVDNITEQYDDLFLEHEEALYIIAASGAHSGTYSIENISAEYISDNEIKLMCGADYKLFDNAPESVVLEFTFISENDDWLCSSSPDFSTCVKTYMDALE